MLKTQKNQILYPHFRKPHFWNLQPFQGIVNGTSQNWQPFQGRRISRLPSFIKVKSARDFQFLGCATLSIMRGTSEIESLPNSSQNSWEIYLRWSQHALVQRNQCFEHQLPTSSFACHFSEIHEIKAFRWLCRLVHCCFLLPAIGHSWPLELPTQKMFRCNGFGNCQVAAAPGSVEMLLEKHEISAAKNIHRWWPDLSPST